MTLIQNLLETVSPVAGIVFQSLVVVYFLVLLYRYVIMPFAPRLFSICENCLKENSRLVIWASRLFYLLCWSCAIILMASIASNLSTNNVNG